MLYGDRIRLRAAERSDIPRFVAWFNDREVTRNLILSTPMSLADEERWFENMLNRPAAEHVLVIEADTDQGWLPLGNVSFMNIEDVNRQAEIGIVIGEKSQWNKGYGRDVMRTMLRFGFESLNLNRIYLRVHADNLRGIKSYEHAGFQHEGCLRQAIYKEGVYVDMLVMSVLRDEWNAAHAKRSDEQE